MEQTQSPEPIGDFRPVGRTAMALRTTSAVPTAACPAHAEPGRAPP